MGIFLGLESGFLFVVMSNWQIKNILALLSTGEMHTYGFSLNNDWFLESVIGFVQSRGFDPKRWHRCRLVSTEAEWRGLSEGLKSCDQHWWLVTLVRTEHRCECISAAILHRPHLWCTWPHSFISVNTNVVLFLCSRTFPYGSVLW